METLEQDSLTLKWGSLKRWDFHSEKGKELLKEYFDLGSSVSAIMQKDNERQKEIICELIDEGNFETVYLDWDDKNVSKKEAKEYVMTYGAK